ncbi:MAG: inositol monophosphatase [Bacteroidales bacterium]|nr:inositol monophosphatase [Bacteroidales bacterium]
MNLELITKQVCNLSRTVGSFIKKEIRNIKFTDIEHKGIHNFVTYVDKASEKRLVSELSKILPEAGFIAEENSDYKKGELYNWIIDPLDGTTNFIHSLPMYSISIALMKNNEIISGVIYEINLQECFYTWKGSSAFLNGNPIKVTETKKINDTLLATGFPYYDYDRLEEYMELFKYFMRNTHGIRRLGSAAVDLAYVACGRFDGFYEYGLNAWDVSAGALLVKQAGGKITDFSGTDNYIYGKEIIASNSNVYEEFLNVIKRFF